MNRKGGGDNCFLLLGNRLPIPACRQGSSQNKDMGRCGHLQAEKAWQKFERLLCVKSVLIGQRFVIPSASFGAAKACAAFATAILWLSSRHSRDRLHNNWSKLSCS
jgi:hypothetical protein